MTRCQRFTHYGRRAWEAFWLMVRARTRRAWLYWRNAWLALSWQAVTS